MERPDLKVRQLNHVALHVANVDQSVAFYRDVLCLPPMERPAFDFPGAWFRLGADQELHLIGDREMPVYSGHRGTHVAFIVDNLDAVGEPRLGHPLGDGQLQRRSRQAARQRRRCQPQLASPRAECRRAGNHRGC